MHYFWYNEFFLFIDYWKKVFILKIGRWKVQFIWMNYDNTTVKNLKYHRCNKTYSLYQILQFSFKKNLNY